MMMLWVSALIPGRTRKSHAERHGLLYTQKEVNDFYAVNGNAIHCLCSIVSTVVNEKGEALAKNLIAKMKKQEESFMAKM